MSRARWFLKFHVFRGDFELGFLGYKSMEIENFPFLWLPNPVIEKSLTPNAGSSSNSGYKSLTQTHHKCSPPDRVSERDSSGHRSNEACPKCSPPERASERKRGSCDGERELWRRERVATESATERGGATQRELRARQVRERKSWKFFRVLRCICSKWNSSLEETSYSWNLLLSQLQTWQSWQKFKCNSSLGETSFNWNSSLLKTSRLHPSIVLKQYDFAK